MGQWLEAWLQTMAAQVRATTLESYAEKVRLHLAPELGRVRLSRLTPQHVEHFMRSKLDNGLSPRSVNYCRAILRKSLHDAERHGLVMRNVAALAHPVKEPHKEVEPLRVPECRALLAAAEGHRLRALVAVGLALGLRRGEMLGLRWSDADLDASSLTVSRTLVRVSSGLTFSEPKSRAGRRTIPLPGLCVQALRAHKVTQDRERLRAGFRWREHDLVFCTAIGTPLEPRNVSRLFEGLCESAGIGKRNLHQLRHTAASLLAAQGVHPRVAMQVLGHSQLSLTVQTYTHVADALGRDAVDLIERALYRI